MLKKDWKKLFYGIKTKNMSFLNIFKSKIPEQNYSVLNTDLHSHFIPGIDDGCKNLEESVELLKIMLLCGFRSVVCTPHVQFEYYRNTPDIIFVFV